MAYAPGFRARRMAYAPGFRARCMAGASVLFDAGG